MPLIIPTTPRTLPAACDSTNQPVRADGAPVGHHTGKVHHDRVAPGLHLRSLWTAGRLPGRHLLFFVRRLWPLRRPALLEPVHIWRLALSRAIKPRPSRYVIDGVGPRGERLRELSRGAQRDPERADEDVELGIAAVIRAVQVRP
jgi:hypothetical protein